MTAHSFIVGKNIATNGHHEAVKVGDTVFDNMNPSGINYQDGWTIYIPLVNIRLFPQGFDYE